MIYCTVLATVILPYLYIFKRNEMVRLRNPIYLSFISPTNYLSRTYRVRKDSTHDSCKCGPQSIRHRRIVILQPAHNGSVCKSIYSRGVLESSRFVATSTEFRGAQACSLRSSPGVNDTLFNVTSRASAKLA